MENNTDLINRLARSCARGSRQLALVNELIAGPVKVQQITIHASNQYPKPIAVVYGEINLEFKSWKNLRSRLLAVGFFFPYSEDKTSFRMVFSG